MFILRDTSSSSYETTTTLRPNVASLAKTTIVDVLLWLPMPVARVLAAVVRTLWRGFRAA